MMVACDNSNDNDYDDGSIEKTRACVCVYRISIHCFYIHFVIDRTQILCFVYRQLYTFYTNIFHFHLQKQTKKAVIQLRTHNNIAFYYSDAHYTLLGE